MLLTEAKEKLLCGGCLPLTMLDFCDAFVTCCDDVDDDGGGKDCCCRRGKGVAWLSKDITRFYKNSISSTERSNLNSDEQK